MRLSPINKLNIYDFDGELISFKGDNFSHTVTPNHRVAFMENGKMKIKEAQELLQEKNLVLPTIDGINIPMHEKEYPIDENLLLLCFFSIFFGTYDTEKLVYSLNEENCERIVNALTTLEIGYKREGNTIIINAIDAGIILRLMKHDVSVFPHFLFQLSSSQSNFLLQTIGENNVIQNTNKQYLENLQQIAFNAGTSSFISGDKLFLNEEQHGELKVKEIEKVCYKGKVWCPTTDDGIVVFREEEDQFPVISGNSIFHNVSVYDRNFYNSMFGHFYFPDGTHIEYDDFNEFQKFFLEWLRQERTKSNLTFPVLTEASLDVQNENGEWEAEDKEWMDFCAEERSKGLSFFSYNSKSVDALASCCLSGDEQIKVFIDGKEEILSVKELVDKFATGEETKLAEDAGMYVSSFNKETQELEKKPVTGVLKRHHFGVMYSFSINGNVITVTPDHPFTVMKIDTQEIVTITAKELKEHFNDYLVPCEE